VAPRIPPRAKQTLPIRAAFPRFHVGAKISPSPTGNTVPTCTFEKRQPGGESTARNGILQKKMEKKREKEDKVKQKTSKGEKEKKK
jgi:hypothetical protein